jgi:hypothetical protein
MGTYGCRREKGTKDIEFFQKEMGWEKEDGSYCRILDNGRKGNVVYLKVETNTPKNQTERFILVCVTHWYRNEYFNFAYKPMEEDMGPMYWDCPLRLFDDLTEPKTDTAKEWRERVRACHTKKSPIPKFGQVIKFEHPIRFTDGFEGDTFRVVRYGVKAKVYIGENDKRYRISGVRERKFEVLEHDAQPCAS